MTLDLSEEEKHALVELLTTKINDDSYPLSPRVRTLKAILYKLAPPPTVTATPIPAPKSGDGPRAALAARKRRRRG